MITADELKNKIGFDEKEAKVYFALLREGSGYASNIAAVAGIKRSTTYQVLERLHEYGIALKYMKGKKYFFAPAKPRSIVEYLDRQEQAVQKRREDFIDLLPELNVYFAHKQKKPKMVFYTKKHEVEHLYFDALQPRGQNEILGFISLDVLQSQFNDAFFKKYAAEVKKHHQHLKLINYDDGPKAKKDTQFWIGKYFNALPKDIRPKVKVVAEQLDMTSNIFISAHKTYLIDTNPPEYMGTVISNQDMTTGFSVIFNNLWKKIK